MHCNAIELNSFRRNTLLGQTMARGKKRQVCFRIEESIVEEMEKIREKTGVPISTQIELRLKGFAITSVKEKRKGNWDKVWQWYTNVEKDEELADNVDMASTRTRRELKLH
jgi:hypothetical protein